MVHTLCCRVIDKQGGASRAGATEIKKKLSLILNRHILRINVKSKRAFRPAPSMSDIRSRAEKFSAASSSLVFQADSREIMQYLQEGNLISSLRQTHPQPINNSPRSQWEESRGGDATRGSERIAQHQTMMCCSAAQHVHLNNLLEVSEITIPFFVLKHV